MSTYTVINPATAEPVTEVRLASVEETDALIERAQDAFPAWRDVAPGERARSAIATSVIGCSVAGSTSVKWSARVSLIGLTSSRSRDAAPSR